MKFTPSDLCLMKILLNMKNYKKLNYALIAVASLCFFFTCHRYQKQSIIDTNLQLSQKSGFEMIEVKGGKFTMGGSDKVDDVGPIAIRLADECPHEVQVGDFSIGKYEVTQSDWLDIMGTNPSYQTDCLDCPVEQVSWQDVQVFITKLNSKYIESFRLPTEEEWEFAAKGGAISNKAQYAGSNLAQAVAWFENNSEGKTHPVGSLQSNELGIYDMSGNIWEWCSNAKTPYSCDGMGSTFKSKVLRGGSFSHRQQNVRNIDRNARDSSLRLPTLGFRLAKDKSSTICKESVLLKHFQFNKNFSS